jgi:signal transduction histidine kinase
MTALFRKNRTSRLKITRAYLLLVLVFTLMLFGTSVISLHEQRQKTEAASLSNLHHSGERIALDIEQRIGLMAADCLSRESIGSLGFTSAGEPTLEDVRRYRNRFEDIRRRCPVAEHFFVINGNRLVFPLVDHPAAQSPRSRISTPPTPEEKVYLNLLDEGAAAQSPRQAADAFRNAGGLPVADHLKAHALSREAAALEKAGRKPAALEAYRRLIRNYGDHYDESGTPYILALAAGPEERARSLFQSPPQSLHDVYRNLLDGRWELSAAQADNVSTVLEQRLGLNPDRQYLSRFMEHLHLAAGVERKLDNHRPVKAYTVTADSFRFENRPYQTFQVLVPGNPTGNRDGDSLVIGFSVSTSWLRESIIPAYTRDARYAAIRTAALIETSGLDGIADSEHETYASFRTILPFWKIHLSAPPSIGLMTAERGELLFTIVPIFMSLSIFGIGLFLLVRTTWDLRWVQLRSDFVSGVSHEFKTPLSLIRLYSETLAEGEQDYTPEERRDYIRIIARESERLSHLVQNVLDFSNIEHNQKRPVLPEGDLGEAVAQAVHNYEDYLRWRGFTLDVFIQPDLPTVRFDPGQISQTIINLLDNARKYSGESRRIVIEVWGGDREVVVEVKDHGIGIPAEEMKNIFQPFYRVPGAKEKGGCGLGLYLVSQVMTNHGGKVEVESKVNQETRFKLTFPATGTTPPRPPANTNGLREIAEHRENMDRRRPAGKH